MRHFRERPKSWRPDRDSAPCLADWSPPAAKLGSISNTSGDASSLAAAWGGKAHRSDDPDHIERKEEAEHAPAAISRRDRSLKRNELRPADYGTSELGAVMKVQSSDATEIQKAREFWTRLPGLH